MKVAIITNTTYETIIPLAKSLSKFCKIELFTIISSRGSGKAILFEKSDLLVKEKPSLVLELDKKGYISELFNEYINNSFKINAIYLKSLFYLNLGNLFTYWQLIKYIRKNTFDIIHINIETPLLILLKVLFPRKHFYLTIHDPIPHSGEDDFQKKIMRKYLNYNHGFNYIFHSQFSKEQFNNYFPNAKNEIKKVIPFGPHDFLLKYKQNNIAVKRGNILFFGRISPYKGINYLIDGFIKAKEKIPYLNLTIAGKGNIGISINNEWKDINIINEYISNEMLCKLIQEAEIIVCPYIDATQSGVIITALTFGKPVLATNVGAASEYIKHLGNGYLINSKSAIDISNALIDLYENYHFLQKITANAKEYFAEKSITWERLAQITKEYYESPDSR